ncbi:MAG: DUF3575 domain-containing protein [Rikenellaceae bacterium]
MKNFALLLLLLCFGQNLFAQNAATTSASDERRVEGTEVQNLQLVFSVLDSYENGDEVLSELRELSSMEGICFTKVVIKSYTSPEGGIAYNKSLAEKRSNKTLALLATEIEIPMDNLYIENYATNWELLKDYVRESDLSSSEKDAVIKIIENYPEEEWGYKTKGDRWKSLIATRNNRFVGINHGHTYRYMLDNLYPKMRVSDIVISYTLPLDEDTTEADANQAQGAAAQEAQEQTDVVEEEVVAEEIIVAEVETIERPRFAIKTNLLMLGFGVANIGAEVSVGQHSSIELPFIYSPYTIKNDYKLRFLALQPAYRYWLAQGHRGHYFGANLGVAWYNVATNDTKRYQSNNPLFSAGLSYGYRVHFCRNWAAEFEIGGGYASSSYDVYYNFDNGALMDTDYMSYWGITKVGISLVYTFNFVKDEKR